jgi:hypothetical protein
VLFALGSFSPDSYYTLYVVRTFYFTVEIRESCPTFFSALCCCVSFHTSSNICSPLLFE